MNEELELARSYRFRAEELRAIAELDSTTKNHQVLMNVAQDYERMAKTLDAIHDTHRILGKT